MAVDQRPFEAVLVNGTLQFVGGSLWSRSWKGGEPGETIGMTLHRIPNVVIRVTRERQRLGRIELLGAG